MGNLMKLWVGLTALLVVFALALLIGHSNRVLASTDPGEKPSSKGKGRWYEKAALNVGPVESLKGRTGSLLVLQEGSAVYMEGNSTLHHYQMNANGLKGSAVLKGPSKDLLQAVRKGKMGSMTFIVPVDTFKSEDSGLDKNADKALKAKENPEMKFVLTGETLKGGKDGHAYVMTADGKLTVAGVTVPVVLTADTTFQDGQVRLQGVQKLKFTDFKIAPPKASILFVTITCDDGFEVHYDVIFAAKSDAAKSGKG